MMSERLIIVIALLLLGLSSASAEELPRDKCQTKVKFTVVNAESEKVQAFVRDYNTQTTVDAMSHVPYLDAHERKTVELCGG